MYIDPHKDTYPFSMFHQRNAFTIVVFCGAQSTLHSYAISIIHAKFHLPKKTPFMVNFFICFFVLYQIT
jgi:hypothetical protein